eukprot:6192330-Pleurochrysis_carterae.AAC.1
MGVVASMLAHTWLYQTILLVLPTVVPGWGKASPANLVGCPWSSYERTTWIVVKSSSELYKAAVIRTVMCSAMPTAAEKAPSRQIHGSRQRVAGTPRIQKLHMV